MAEQRGDESASADEPPKKKAAYRRMSASVSVQADMGVLGALIALQREAKELKAAGCAYLLGDVERMKPHLSCYLSGSAARLYSDEAGEDHREDNKNAFEAIQKKYGAMAWSNTTGTIPVQLNAELCFNLHFDLIEKLKRSDSVKEDGDPGLYLDTKGGTAIRKKSGGFQVAYQQVNVSAMRFSKSEQDRCTFGMTPAELKSCLGSRGERFIADCKQAIELAIPNTVVLFRECHALFHWNDHSFFTYHQDDKGDVAVVVNLSPGITTLHVAGCGESSMQGVGSAHILLTKAFHRSGKATRRCIKLVAFFDLQESVKLEGDSDAEQAGSGGASTSETHTAQPPEYVKRENVTED